MAHIGPQADPMCIFIFLKEFCEKVAVKLEIREIRVLY